ncbi:MAG: redoxin domain-containing protein [Terriglobales bacterium]
MKHVKRRKLSSVLAMWLLTTAMICPLMNAQDNKAQATKPAAVPMKLNVGDVAPDFKLHYFDGSDLKEISLSQYRGKSNVVLAFYIFAFTGG